MSLWDGLEKNNCDYQPEKKRGEGVKGGKKKKKKKRGKTRKGIRIFIQVCGNFKRY